MLTARVRCAKHLYLQAIWPALDVVRHLPDLSNRASSRLHDSTPAETTRRISMPNSGRPPEDAPQPGEEEPGSPEANIESDNRPPVSSTSEETLEERLARIQKNLAAGKYDSDEMLDRAAEIMFRKILNDPE